MHRRWLAGLSFEHAARYIVLEDCIAAVEAAAARRDHLESHIAAALSAGVKKYLGACRRPRRCAYHARSTLYR